MKLVDCVGHLGHRPAVVVRNAVRQVVKHARVLAQRNIQLSEAFRLFHGVAARVPQPLPSALHLGQIRGGEGVRTVEVAFIVGGDRLRQLHAPQPNLKLRFLHRVLLALDACLQVLFGVWMTGGKRRRTRHARKHDQEQYRSTQDAQGGNHKGHEEL